MVGYVGLLAGCGAAAIVGARCNRAVRRRNGRHVQDGGGQHWLSHRATLAIHGRERARHDQCASVPARLGIGSFLFQSAVVGCVACRILIAQWWNPVSWWGDVGGAVSAVGNAVKQLIHDGVDFAIRTVEAIVDAGFHILTATIDDAIGLIGDVYHFAQSVWSEVVHIVTVDLPHWIDYAINVAAGWVHDVEHALDDVFHWAADAVGSILHEIESLSDWIWHNIIDPVFNWIDHAVDWWWHLIDGWWNTIYRDVIEPIEHLLQQAWHLVNVVWDWVFHVAYDIVQICIKAEKWLVWFAEHPYSGFEEIVHDAASEFTLSHIINLANTADNYLDDILNDAAKVLG